MRTSWKDLLYPGDACDFFLRKKFKPFNLSESKFSFENALWLAELSRLVYRHDKEEKIPPPEPTQTNILDKQGFKQRQFFYSKKTNTQAMLVEFKGDSSFAVLVFRGTEQHIKDFITDLEVGIPPLKDDLIDVHNGFDKALDSVWEDIGVALRKLNCPLFYTGHSLGAALATLAAARHPPQAVYTFGSPRVGNQMFVNSIQDINIYRVVDDQDLVTTIPPESLGFAHAGYAQLLKQHPNKSVLAWIWKFLSPPKPLADHAPVNYVDRL